MRQFCDNGKSDKNLKHFNPLPIINIIFFIMTVFLLIHSQRLIAGVTDEEITSNENGSQISSAALQEIDVINLALERSRKLESQDTHVQMADYQLQSSGKLRNPELRISDISTRYYTRKFDELQVGLRFRFPKIGELGEAKQQAEVDLWRVKVEALRYRYALIAKVRQDYADVIYYDKLSMLRGKRASLGTKRIDIIDQMMELGLRSVVYQTKARMMLSEWKNNLVRTAQNQRLARRKLSKKAGIAEEVILTGGDLPEITQDLDQLIEIAFVYRPEIGLVEQMIELAEKQKSFESFKLLPWPTFVEVSYHREKIRPEDWGELMVGINLPFFDWNRGNIKAANLQVTRKEDQLEGVREQIENEVRDAYIVYSDLLLDWKNFSRDAKTMTAAAKSMIDEARKHETLPADEVLEMEMTIIEMEETLCEKRRDLAHALSELYFALGVHGDEELSQESKP